MLSELFILPTRQQGMSFILLHTVGSLVQLKFCKFMGERYTNMEGVAKTLRGTIKFKNVPKSGKSPKGGGGGQHWKSESPQFKMWTF